MNNISPLPLSPAILRQKLLPRPTDGHKGTFGHALLIAGSRGMMGASLLAAQAAMRSGLGKLTVAVPQGQEHILQIGLPEALVRIEAESPDYWTSPVEMQPYQSVVIGPGIGQAGETQWALRTQLQMLTSLQLEGRAPALVLDADALNLIAADYQLLSLVPQHTILTPHFGEMQRLCRTLDLPHADVSATLASAQLLAHELQFTIVVKSHQTHIFTPDNQRFMNDKTGNAGMATAGSGDVLAGLIGGLLAQGHNPVDAVCLGVYLHAYAGDCAAQIKGQHALIASDLIQHLPQAFASLLPAR